MRPRTTFCAAMLAASFTALLSAAPISGAAAQGATAKEVKIDARDIGGVVTGAKGPEAGVWVIAETRDLPTRYVKIVVTDDQAVTCCPSCRKAPMMSGYAGMVSSTLRRLRRSPASSSI